MLYLNCEKVIFHKKYNWQIWVVKVLYVTIANFLDQFKNGYGFHKKFVNIEKKKYGSAV